MRARKRKQVQMRKAGDGTVALTGSFEDLLQVRAASDPVFGKALLCEGVDALLAGDVDTGTAVLRRLDDAIERPANR